MNVPRENAKTSLRAQVRARLRNLAEVERAAASARLCAFLREKETWVAALSVLFFAPLPDEPDLWSLLIETIAAGKMVALPAFNS